MGQHAHPIILGGSLVIIGDKGPLSDRESEVTVLISEGFGDIEIGALLDIAPSTSAQYAENSKNKLGAVNRANLVQKAFALGILITINKRLGRGVASTIVLATLLTTLAIATRLPRRPPARAQRTTVNMNLVVRSAGRYIPVSMDLAA